MRLVVISDTHGLHNRIEDLPDGDVLVHAGDFMNSGYDPEDTHPITVNTSVVG
jgi:predicted phosphodiesterase